MDVRPEAWAPPPEFAPLAQLRGLPHHGIGRSCKAGKEEIVGLLAALDRFASEDPGERHARWAGLLQAILAEAGAPDGVALALLEDKTAWSIPVLRATMRDGRAASRLAALLRAGSPSIECQTGAMSEGVLVFSPVALVPEQAGTIGRRLREAASSL